MVTFRKIVTKLFIAFLGIGFLNGCTGNQGAVWESIKIAFEDPNNRISDKALNPQFLYLKAEVDGNPALLVLGYVDPHPQGNIDIWYTESKELIKLQGGRFIGSQGLDLNWNEVELINPPVLSELKPSTPTNLRRANRQLRFTRIRTVMPGYHRIRENVMLEVLKETPADVPKLFREDRNLVWVQETATSNNPENYPQLAPLQALYAIKTIRNARMVVYGKQCLSVTSCLSWQIWPSATSDKQ